MKKVTLLVPICALVLFSFSDKKNTKTYWYKSVNNAGYISVEKAETPSNQSILKTTINAFFGKEKLNFSLATTSDSHKLANASKIEFDGTIDSNINPIVYSGERVKSDKNGSFWSFTGDYKSDITNDEEVNQFLKPHHKSMIRMPKHTIPSFNVWAIVPELPFDKKEGTFRFHALDETKLYVKKNQTISYLGKVSEDINGTKETLHKFIHQGVKMKATHYWVNDNRELVKIVLDGEFEFVLSTKEEALGLRQ
ncbi:MAG: hypothetical protein QNJ57_10870 [Flavobacteriaceae bacterium]|nr:hypothetical protein [Flavobacteriaceae bacterium]